MSEQLVQFTKDSVDKAKRGQAKFAWLMLLGIVLTVAGFFNVSPGFTIPFGVLLILIASIGWTVSGNRIQRLEREHLDAKAAWEAKQAR